MDENQRLQRKTDLKEREVEKLKQTSSQLEQEKLKLAKEKSELEVKPPVVVEKVVYVQVQQPTNVVDPKLGTSQPQGDSNKTQEIVKPNQDPEKQQNPDQALKLVVDPKTQEKKPDEAKIAIPEQPKIEEKKPSTNLREDNSKIAPQEVPQNGKTPNPTEKPTEKVEKQLAPEGS